jgi:hypothetical protein
MIDPTDRWLLNVIIFEFSKELTLEDVISSLKLLSDCGYWGFVSLKSLNGVKIGDCLGPYSCDVKGFNIGVIWMMFAFYLDESKEGCISHIEWIKRDEFSLLANLFLGP